VNFEKKLFPPEWCYSPEWVNNRFKEIQAKYGIDIVANESRFQKAREMWITGMYLLGLEVKTGSFFWVFPEYNDPPDTFGVAVGYQDNSAKQYRINFGFEITEWHQLDPLHLVGAIKKKLLGKIYSSDTTLLVYLSRGETTINLDLIYDELQGNVVGVKEIWFLSPVMNKTQMLEQVVVQIFPKKDKIQFEASSAYRHFDKQPPIIAFYRGTKGGFKVAPPINLPLP
jgi:hypothetical protein